jgi:hypothetical protein
MDGLLKKALAATRESKFIEFKEAFDVASSGDWCELIKDIIALANTGGGVILIGVDNHGEPNGFDIRQVLGCDSADITNKIHKYTGWQFSEFEISEEDKDSYTVVAFRIQGVPIPIVFTKPGTYDTGGAKQKNAFSAGTVYFRHGAKSEPGNTEDIRRAIERQLESIRKEWTRGVRKVVAAPSGSRVLVIPGKSTRSTKNTAAPIRIVDDPSAPAIRLTRNSDEAAGIFLHEELSDGLFDEINNVLTANDLLAKGKDKFLLGSSIYYRIYAERHHIVADPKQVKLLALTGLQDIYGPGLYWLLRLPADSCVSILRQMCESPKSPNVRTAIRIMILLGRQATNWLYDLWTQKWPHQGQHPDFYWSIKKIASQKDDVDRRLVALQTMSGIPHEISDGKQKHSANELIESPQLAASYLSKVCMRVFDGDKESRSMCRQLDIMAYGKELESLSQKIVDGLTGNDKVRK